MWVDYMSSGLISATFSRYLMIGKQLALTVLCTVTMIALLANNFFTVPLFSRTYSVVCPKGKRASLLSCALKFQTNNF